MFLLVYDSFDVSFDLSDVRLQVLVKVERRHIRRNVSYRRCQIVISLSAASVPVTVRHAAVTFTAAYMISDAVTAAHFFDLKFIVFEFFDSHSLEFFLQFWIL